MGHGRGSKLRRAACAKATARQVYYGWLAEPKLEERRLVELVDTFRTQPEFRLALQNLSTARFRLHRTQATARHPLL